MNVYAIINGIDIFDESPQQYKLPIAKEIPMVTIERKNYQVVDITSDKYIILMDESGNLREDMQLPNGKIGENILLNFDKEIDQTISILSTHPSVGREKLYLKDK